MSTVNLIQETITVHGVNPRGNAKFKSGGGVLVDPDKLLWVNTVVGFDMSMFQKGNTYLVEREVSEAGKKGHIVSIKLEDIKGPSNEVVTATGNGNSKYVSNSDGQRKGAIGHYVSRIIAAELVIGALKPAAVLIRFNQLFEGIDKTFS